MQPRNLYHSLPTVENEEAFDELLAGEAWRLERIVSRGQSTPANEWLEQVWGEWVLVLQGEAKLLIAGEEEPHALRAGDTFHLPPGVKHRVQWTDPNQPTIWLALHYQK